ncbi:alpha/beta hydrolase [Neobacillus mesonae]|nr:alpha/beta hydrolase [Neobacillus mesonae]
MQRYKKLEGKQLIYNSYDSLLQFWEVEIEERDIDTSYGKTHIITAGDTSNPPLLLFHGTADNSAMMWIYNMKFLAERFFVVAIDAIGGSGKSEPNDQYYNSFNQIIWLDEILNALELETTNVCGVSYGAYLSYYYAVKRPGRVNKAVCLAGRIPSSSFEVFSKMMFAFMPEALFPSERNCRKLLRKLSGPNLSAFENNEILMKHWYYLLKYFNNKSMFQHKIEISENTELAILQEKALFLIGEHDQLSNYAKAHKRLIENGIQYKIIENAGHAINHEQPDVINNEIANFIL